ncbi:YicC family protein [Brevibacillus humidisoli]|uniref:YicC/YloC family endoribonuclease n=1 Tax=Brevibacillus humidisoli TaxID=2895522 RepID=UPI001E597B52|nr:YicC/YloC family endoribonuclease [Brevibacillus humidisoli]UFJ41980.1 YicC family protein [Brevibacillus humidisoli]
MIRSMTGYGRREAEHAHLRLVVEMRAVNHRFCEVVVRLPKSWTALEDQVRKAVLRKVRRGRVEVFVSVEASAGQGGGFSINREVAAAYILAAKDLSEQYVLNDELAVKDLLQLPGVVQTGEEASHTLEEAAEWLLPLVEGAADDLLVMRKTEGSALVGDLRQRLQNIKSWSQQIGEQAAGAVADYRKRLKERLAEWSADIQIDEQRIAQEVLLFADRADISEEATRLASHCQQFAELLDKDEVVGRKLDFLLQEMNREANTIAAKANYLPIQRLAVEMKTELEKMREQVQNVE